MKSRILCLFALILGMVSCEQNPSVDEQPSEQVKVRLTASVETTRTVLGEDLSVLWQEQDYIVMWATSAEDDLASSIFRLVEGAGTNEAVFEGYMPTAGFVVDKYYATYGDNITPWILDIPNNQLYVPGSFGRYWAYGELAQNHMIAEYTPESDSLYFQNLFGMLELQVYGEGFLDSIALFTQDGNSLAGSFEIDPTTLTLTQMSDVNNMRLEDIFVFLTDTPQSFYIVLPPCTMENLNVVVEVGGREYISVATNPIEISRGVITPVTPAIEVKMPVASYDCWQIVGTMNDWAPGYGIPMENVDEWGSMVAAYKVELTTEDEFKFVYGDSWDLNYGYNKDTIGAGYYYTADLAGSNIKVAADGVYDLYLDSGNKRFYVMNAGDDWQNAEAGEVVPTEDTYSVLGDFVESTWADIFMEDEDGDGIYAVYGVKFADVNGQGAAFKVRKNESWTTQYGSSENSIYDTDQAIPTPENNNNSYNIFVDAVIGLKYDIYFDSINHNVWVMRHGCYPGDDVSPVIEIYTPYMYGVAWKENINIAGKDYDSIVQFALTQSYIFEGWTMQYRCESALFTVLFNENDIVCPTRIISDDITGNCYMGSGHIPAIYFEYVQDGNINGFYFDDAVLNVTENGIEAYALDDGTMWHYVYEGPLKLGFANKTYDGTQTEQFVMLEELDPEWR